MDDFEEHRDHLRAVAFRMLGSSGEAQDALQEAWLRLSSRGTPNVVNPRAYLTTVVARVCLDLLRSRRTRREVGLDESLPAGDVPDPGHEAELADSVGLALLVVLDALTPSERLAFVLHDMFAVPFADIARILDRSVPAAKMLASRARRRVRSAEAPRSDRRRERSLVEAFLAASRHGDFAALVRLLDPDVTVSADALRGSTLTGAGAVAEQALTFARLAEHARVTVIDGILAIVVAPRSRNLPGNTPVRQSSSGMLPGKLRDLGDTRDVGGRGDVTTVMTFEFSGERITGIDVITDPARLSGLNFA